MRVIRAPEADVQDLAFSPDGQAIAAAVRYHGVYLWNLTSPSSVPVRLDTDDRDCRELAFSNDGRSVAWLVSGTRRMYDRDTRQRTDQQISLTRLASELAQSANCSRLISKHGLPDHCLIGWRAYEEEWIRTWTVSTAELATESITLSPDGTFFAMLTRVALGEGWAANPRRLEVRDAATARIRMIGQYHYNYAEPLTFSPDSRQLAGFNDMTLMTWSLPGDGEPQKVRNDNRKQFTAIAYHPSGRRLYAASNDTTVHVFDTTTLVRLNRFTWHLGRLKSVAVSPDGALAAAGGDKGDIIIWDLDD